MHAGAKIFLHPNPNPSPYKPATRGAQRVPTGAGRRDNQGFATRRVTMKAASILRFSTLAVALVAGSAFAGPWDDSRYPERMPMEANQTVKGAAVRWDDSNYPQRLASTPAPAKVKGEPIRWDDSMYPTRAEAKPAEATRQPQMAKPMTMSAHSGEQSFPISAP